MKCNSVNEALFNPEILTGAESNKVIKNFRDNELAVSQVFNQNISDSEKVAAIKDFFSYLNQSNSSALKRLL